MLAEVYHWHLFQRLTTMRRFILASVTLLAGTGFAQSPDTVIRSSAREVLLDVVVRDAHGRLITNLQAGDVAVYEDGVRQDVRAFRLVSGSEVRIEDQKQAAEAQAAQTRSPSASPGAPARQSVADGERGLPDLERPDPGNAQFRL